MLDVLLASDRSSYVRDEVLRTLRGAELEITSNGLMVKNGRL